MAEASKAALESELVENVDNAASTAQRQEDQARQMTSLFQR
jgi:hypothetical protein